MHECPECGQHCCCSGDLDDCPVMTREWVYDHCTHCDDASDLRDDDAWEDDDCEDEPVPRYPDWREWLDDDEGEG